MEHIAKLEPGVLLRVTEEVEICTEGVPWYEIVDKDNQYPCCPYSRLLSRLANFLRKL